MNLQSKLYVNDGVQYIREESKLYYFKKKDGFICVMNETGYFIVTKSNGNTIKNIIESLILSLSELDQRNSLQIVDECLCFIKDLIDSELVYEAE